VDDSPQSFADALARAMRAPPRPDVEYNLKRHTWADRAERLLAALPRTST
jgi:hypothetical protein